MAGPALVYHPAPDSGDRPGEETAPLETRMPPRPDRVPKPALSILLGLALAGGLAIWASSSRHLLLIDSFDGPWHLACGRLILDSGSVPRSDPFCFTTAGLDWINLNWLAQVLIAGLYRIAGEKGALLSPVLAVLVLILAVFANLRRRGISPVLIPPLVYLASVNSVAVMNLRPRTWTLALIAVTLWLLAPAGPSAEDTAEAGDGGDDEPDRPRLIALALLLQVWNHLHGGFIYGYALIGLAAVASTLERYRRDGTVRSRRALALLGVLVLGGIGLLVLHPHHLGAIEHVLLYQSRVADYQSTVTELLSPNFATPEGRVVELLLIGLVVLPALGYRPALRDLVLLPLFLHFQLIYARFLFLTGLLFVPALARPCELAVRDVIDRCGPRGRALFASLESAMEPVLQRAPRWLVVAVVVGAGLFLALATPHRIRPALRPSPMPAISRLVATPSSGRIFNSYNVGGLLDHALGPTGRVYIDGRGDLHARGAHTATYRSITGCQAGWYEALLEADVELVIFPTRTRLAHELVTVHGWTSLHLDKGWCVLRRPRKS